MGGKTTAALTAEIVSTACLYAGRLLSSDPGGLLAMFNSGLCPCSEIC